MFEHIWQPRTNLVSASVQEAPKKVLNYIIKVDESFTNGIKHFLVDTVKPRNPNVQNPENAKIQISERKK